jgi:hypothetical protein
VLSTTSTRSLASCPATTTSAATVSRSFPTASLPSVPWMDSHGPRAAFFVPVPCCFRVRFASCGSVQDYAVRF